MELSEWYREELEREAEGMDTSEQNDGNTDQDMGFLGILEPSADDFISEILLQQLGSSGRSFKRENRAACKRLVSEMYSPPRVTAEIRRMKHRHLLPGFALDLTVVDPDDGMPWDFSQSGKRQKARELRRKQRPYMLIGSPECKEFSSLQALNEAKSPDPAAYDRAKRRAKKHIEFMVEMYEEQVAEGHYFLHGHPRLVASRQMYVMQSPMSHPEVFVGTCGSVPVRRRSTTRHG
jgi:hypothetical protein